MSTRPKMDIALLRWLPILLLSWPAFANAQVPVDEAGEPIGDYGEADPATVTGNEDIPLLTATELEELVGPIALYPDDLLAIVLPASAYPLQIVQAGRFIEALEDDPSLKPDESWDDSVVALTNYPEVIKLMNDDLDWTWRLGEAVVAQQSDVIAAVETFRDRAYAAGNLKSDAHQTISQGDGYIEITPVDDDVIYVPYYEPAHVVVYQPRPVYYYYPRAYPVYYYPYPASYAFDRGYFWGVTTAFTLGWHTNRLHVFHHSYHGHPYYGHYYWDRWWYRRPTINVYNNFYVDSHVRRTRNYYRSGDYWQPRTRRTIRRSDQRITRTRYYPGNDAQSGANTRSVAPSGTRLRPRSGEAVQRDTRRDAASPAIRFRERPSTLTRSGNDGRDTRVAPETTASRTTPSQSTRQSFVRPSKRGESTATRRQSGRDSDTRAREPRQNQLTQNTLRRSEPRQTQARQAPVQRSEPRQTRVRQAPVPRSEPRQTQVRQAPVRSSQPQRSQVRESASRKSESRQGQRSDSGSVKVTSASRGDRAGRSQRRH